MSRLINWIKTSPILSTGLILILLLLLWLYATKGINGIQSFFFFRKANAEQAKINADLERARQQQVLIDQTLKDLAESKQALAVAKKEREIREQIFNDATKTAKEKVAAYEAAMSANPVRTDPSGVSTDDLCARAKAIGSDPAVIAALCAQ